MLLACYPKYVSLLEGLIRVGGVWPRDGALPTTTPTLATRLLYMVLTPPPHAGFESGTSDSTGSPFFPEPQLLPQVGHTGFESGMRDCTENPFFPEPQLFPQVEYGCPLNYWADDNSLYNPALITPPPQLDSTSSFSLPYLQQSSRMALESSYSIVSPLMGRGANETLFLDVETIEDDVFW